MKQHLRIISRIICFVLIFSIVLSAAYIIHFTDHQCNGNDCEICYHIHTCVQALKEPTIGASVLTGILVLRIVSALIPLFSPNDCFSNTLIRMKVKFSC